MTFNNKTALITGASEGIGKATAIEFAKLGADLILVSRNIEKLNQLKLDLEKFKTKINTYSVDLSNPTEVDRLFSKPINFDIAINNAGTEGNIKEIQNLSLDEFNKVIDLNLRSVWQCIKFEVSHYRKNNKKGSIVNVSSILGIRGISGSSPYVASKFAIIGLTQSIAAEQTKYGIRVNSVSPGATDTPMMQRVLGNSQADFVGLGPQDRLARSEEIAKAIIWLSSEDSEYVIGHNLVIDAGRTTQLG